MIPPPTPLAYKIKDVSVDTKKGPMRMRIQYLPHHYVKRVNIEVANGSIFARQISGRGPKVQWDVDGMVFTFDLNRETLSFYDDSATEIQWKKLGKERKSSAQNLLNLLDSLI